MPDSKCWWVRSRDSDMGEFVFASTRGWAISQSEAFSNDGYWPNMRATRVPALDGKEITKETVEAAGFIYFDDIDF